MRALRIVGATGAALQLQLCFVVCALPVVTILPAAITLQRQWRGYCMGESTTLLGFFREFANVIRLRWIAGLLFAALLLAYGTSVVFWRSVESASGSFALAVLLGLGIVAVAYYLALLSVSAQTRAPRWRPWLASAREALLSGLPRFALAAAAVILMWIVISYLPPMSLVSVGIVPALAAAWASRLGQAKRS